MKKQLAIFLALAMLCTLLPIGTSFASGQPGWTYFASSSEAEGTPSELGPGLAFDGDEETRWSSVFKDAAGSFIGVDFGASYTFNSVIINECKNWGHVTGFKLQKWENNSWVDFYSGNGINDKRRIMFNPVTTTKMRVYFESVDCADENFATVTIFEIDVEMSDSDETQLLGEGGYFEMPLLTNSPTVKGSHLYLVGGYNSNDAGCPIWGTVKNNESLYIGDSAGTLSIVYQSGKKQEVPLIFGYNMWFHNYWSDPNFGSPFKGRYVEPEYQELLKQTLHLEGAFEASESPIMKIKLLEEPVKSIDIIDNAEKPGYAVFKTGYITNGNLTAVASDASFFETHLIDGANPYPQAMQENIKKIQKRLMTFEEDFENAPDFSYPDGYTGTKIDFSGTPLAETASGVVYHNLENLKNRTDSDGMIHTSAKDAPCWHYDGFGPWIDNFQCFYDSFYSRDGARAIMSLANLGATDKAQAGMNYSNKWMMYYPENSLTINGKAIPGHWSVILNKPLEYSKNLTKVGWATQYTQEKFGADYENLGNQETDGHGMMMLANYNVWTRGGQSAQWVNDNRKYINEAASWILWCYENTNESFAKDGLLYAESEGGMMQWTMYCNLPCYLGMKAYAQMAQKRVKPPRRQAGTPAPTKCMPLLIKSLQKATPGAWRGKTPAFSTTPCPCSIPTLLG